MRLSSALLLGAAAVASTYEFNKEDKTRENTYFDGIKVPPLMELTPENFVEAVESAKYMLIKHYSPYCPHCIDFAPTFQTLYEFYYTSKPDAPDAGSKTFTEYYDFRFAMVNCVVYYDMCQEHKVKSYPSSILYVDGKLAESLKGVKSLDALGELVERILESAHPGSRPKTLRLPSPGDKGSPKSGDAKVDAENGTGAGVAAPKSEDTAPVPGTSRDGKGEGNGNGNENGNGDGDGDGDGGAKVQAPIAKARAPAPPMPEKKRTIPVNEAGESEALTAETFETKVSKSKEPWFVKFYAPWCHHCQAMAPKWQQLGRNMKNQLNIGEVNCDKESRLCRAMKIHAFPSIVFFEGGERIDYQGLRGLGDLTSFAKQAMDLTSGIPDVDAESLKAIEAKEDVVFVYFYDHATTSEDFRALDRLPVHLVGRARVVRTSDPALFDRFRITTWPRLLVSREGRPTYFKPLTPREMRDVPAVLDWMKSAWLPIVPELTAANAREVMDGKMVVLGILNRDGSEAFLSSKREIKSAANEWMDRQIQEFQLERKKLRDAKQMRIEEAEDRGDQRALRNAKNIQINLDKTSRKEVTFAWVDGVFWQRWIKTTYGVDAKDGERIIINDEDNRRYWDMSVTGNYILVSRTSILETLDKVINEPHAIKPKLTISVVEKLFFDVKMFWIEHTYVAVGGTLGAIYLFVQWMVSRGRTGRNGGYLQVDDAVAGPGLKKEGGFLGGNGNGKTD